MIMKKKFLFTSFFATFIFCIVATIGAQNPVLVPAKRSSMKLVPDPKKIYEWSQPYSSTERLLVTVGVYDVNKFTTLIGKKITQAKL